MKEEKKFKHLTDEELARMDALPVDALIEGYFYESEELDKIKETKKNDGELNSLKDQKKKIEDDYKAQIKECEEKMTYMKARLKKMGKEIKEIAAALKKG